MRSPQELATEAEKALKTLDGVFREASEVVIEQPAEVQREFRRLRRKYARFHSDAGDFIDNNVPDITILAGGT